MATAGKDLIPEDVKEEMRQDHVKGDLPKAQVNSWRKGQTIFNFLEWLYQKGYEKGYENYRMADPFYITDSEWDRLFKEFIEENK